MKGHATTVERDDAIAIAEGLLTRISPDQALVVVPDRIRETLTCSSSTTTPRPSSAPVTGPNPSWGRAA